MSGHNYTSAIGIEKLSQPFNLIVLGIFGILCLICLVLKLLEKIIPHSKQYVFRVVMYNKNNVRHCKNKPAIEFPQQLFELLVR